MRLITLTALAMLAFAANSILCRLALRETAIDPATFTSVRLVSGALALALIVSMRGMHPLRGGNWPSSAALFAYALAFSFAYTKLSAGSGALLLFGAVQTTMLLWGWHRGERLSALQGVGIALAVCGLVGLVFPGISTPPIDAAALMLSAGLAWAVYSLRGRGRPDALSATTGNFFRAVPLTLVASFLFREKFQFDAGGIGYACASGALTSGVGYAIWYAALRGLDATRAAVVQLCVPALAAAGGVLLLGETFDLRLVMASLAILSGVGLAIASRQRPIGSKSGTTS